MNHPSPTSLLVESGSNRGLVAPLSFDATPTEQYLMNLQSPESRKTMTRILNQIARMFGAQNHKEFDWLRLDKDKLLMLREAFGQKSLKVNTRQLYQQAIRGVFKEAFKRGLVDDAKYGEIASVEPIKGQDIVHRPITLSEDVATLINHCLAEDSVIGYRDAALIGLVALNGLRRAEAAIFHTKDIAGDGIFVVQGKGNRQRRLTLHSLVSQLIDKWFEYRSDTPGYVFCRVRRHGFVTPQMCQVPLSGTAVYNVMVKREKECKLSNVRPHACRRHFGTNQLRNGQDLAEVQKLMGHSDPSTTALYRIVSDDEMKEAIESIQLDVALN
ncbi:MAG: tyrosine-type recombinase/integrase [Alteromonadaceae bacterium]|nr:tyrosine-type recombinase/integrase [Alteromonadaceae bacterium]